MGQFFSLKNSKFFSGLKKNCPIVTSITTSVIENIFFNFLYDIKNRCHRMKISTLYQFLFFTIPYLYLNRALLCDNCKVRPLFTKP